MSNDEKYIIKLKLTVKDNLGNQEHFSKTVNLPFTPYIGLQILLENSNSGNPIGPITSVMWNEWSEIFVCDVEWRIPPDTYSEDDYLSLESHISVAKSDGWEQD